MLNWIQRFDTFCFLDNHQYNPGHATQECLAGAGKRSSISLSGEGSQRHAEFSKYLDLHRDSWIFGHLGYYFNDTSARLMKPDPSGFQDLFFYEAEVVIRVNESGLTIIAEDPQQVFQEIDRSPGIPGTRTGSETSPKIRSTLQRGQYESVIEQLRAHILRGDCYEINYCMEFFADDADIDPVGVYQRLTRLSPNPFSALYRIEDRWLLCASPERYLRKTGSKVISQPIKGTSRRNKPSDGSDEADREKLYRSQKDRSENVMVVDLVRNDFSRFCIEGTVRVEELYGIYTFPQVHQMISTITGEVDPGTSFATMVPYTFPMGSMTGAPKKRVMELISEYEQPARGLFSGSLGYIDPSGDFDFNVVIRSILYDAKSRHLSMPAGSGITFYSDPSGEWEECMLKVEAMKSVFDVPSL